RPANPAPPSGVFLTPTPSPAFPDLCRAARLLPGQLRRTLATGQQRLGVRLEVTEGGSRSLEPACAAPVARNSVAMPISEAVLLITVCSFCTCHSTVQSSVKASTLG